MYIAFRTYNEYFNSPLPHGATANSGPGPPHDRGLLWTSDRADGENLRTHISHKGQTSMPSAG